MHGVLNLLKPPGMTSHDAVAFARRVLKTRRIGHTGTLDPAAAGVLPLCVGQATRLVEELQVGTKEYLAEATFGRETDSGDATGHVVREVDASTLDLEALRAAMNEFRGEITQTPPLHSAVKVGGRKLYELARAGESIEIPTRQVTISKLLATRFLPGAQPRAMLHIECSGGTYIRSLVRDIGRELGLAATMTFLVRNRSGAFSLSEAVTLEDAEASGHAALVPILNVLDWCAPRVAINDELTHALSQGRRVKAELRVFARSDLDERKRDANAYQVRLSRLMHNANAGKRALFRTHDGGVAALAELVAGDEALFAPVKVFDLRGDA